MCPEYRNSTFQIERAVPRYFEGPKIEREWGKTYPFFGCIEIKQAVPVISNEGASKHNEATEFVIVGFENPDNPRRNVTIDSPENAP